MFESLGSLEAENHVLINGSLGQLQNFKIYLFLAQNTHNLILTGKDG